MNSTLITPLSTPWLAAYLPSRQAEPAPLSPLSVDARWVPLRQAWLPGGNEQGFNPGLARIHWNDTELSYDVIMLGSRPANRARRLNERTWELGDVCEVFVQAVGAESYVELHVTPENQRLQLLWPAGGLARFRNNAAPLEDFAIAQTDWVKTGTHIGPGFWVAHAVIPLTCFGLTSLTPASGFRTAVCRYDCDPCGTTFLSTTAPLRAADYHCTADWQYLVLRSP